MKEVYNCKQRFGFSYIWTCDSATKSILDTFCQTYGLIWNMFFGLRKTGANGQAFYWIPTKKLEFLLILTENK